MGTKEAAFEAFDFESPYWDKESGTKVTFENYVLGNLKFAVQSREGDSNFTQATSKYYEDKPLKVTHRATGHVLTVTTQGRIYTHVPDDKIFAVITKPCVGLISCEDFKFPNNFFDVKKQKKESKDEERRRLSVSPTVTRLLRRLREI